MGLFDDFDVDMDEVKAAGGFDFEDGHYEFEISEALTQNGTKNKPDVTFFIIKYDFDEAGTYWEWFTIAVDGDTEHPDAARSQGYLKSRLLDLGFKAAELNDTEPEDLEGIRGSLQLLTTNGKGKNKGNKYQNVRNVKVEHGDPDEADEPEPEPEVKPTRRRAAAAPKEDDTAAADAAAKKRVAERREAREAEAAPAKPTRGRRPAAASSDEDEENPFG